MVLALNAQTESEGRFSAIFEQAAVGVAQIDSHTGEFTLINNKYCEIAGYSREEMSSTTFQAITHPEDLALDLSNMEKLRAGEIREFSMEKRYIRKDGSLVWVNLTVSPGWSPGGKPSYHIAVVEDITQRKILEERLLRVQRLESLGTLAAGIAHDFNNLLTSMFGWLEVIRFRTSLPPIIECVNKSMESLERGRDLTRRLLTFAGGGAPVKTILDLNQLLLQVCASLQTETHTINVELGKDLPTVDADPEQMKLALENLLTNARLAMPAGGHIEATTELRPSGHVRITIADHGPGVRPHLLHRIFDPFFTTTPGRAGLGLAMVHSIISRHGGHIHVDNSPAGASFVIDMPPSNGAAPGHLTHSMCGSPLDDSIVS